MKETRAERLLAKLVIVMAVGGFVMVAMSWPMKRGGFVDELGMGIVVALGMGLMGLALMLLLRITRQKDQRERMGGPAEGVDGSNRGLK